ncbi:MULTISPECIES: YfbM family protein [unclassified Actinomadura]|uniref:YfbM family protein n=1 Tax=unclassified Actinomadura TaxID=2626254 RepID=UPI0013590630|nr:YfbM family protein [Actinomadura sp. K4S16]
MLGVHFAITDEQERALLAGDEDAVAELLEDLEENWEDDHLKVDTDKAWEAVHRCLGDGTLDYEGYPLSHAVLGGRHLHQEFYVVHVSAAEVRDVAEALRPLDKGRLRQRYDTLPPDDHAGPRGDQDFEYTWTNFADVRAFYQRAAKAGRAVIFTAT